MEVNKQEELNKSIDELIDSILCSDEEATDNVEKGQSDEGLKPQTKADDVKPGEKVEDDEKRNAGRPKQISDVPDNDEDGERDGEYDADITTESSDGKNPEQKQVEPPAAMKKSLTDAEYAEYQSLKKAKEAASKADDLAKAQKAQVDLIKSAVSEALKDVRAENEALKKSLEEQGELIKSIANRPQKPKAVTSVQALEKSFAGEGQTQVQQKQTLSKSEILDVATEMVEKGICKGEFTLEHVSELELTGGIYDTHAKAALEKEVMKRYRR